MLRTEYATKGTDGVALSDGTRRALAVALHEAGYTFVARMLAEDDEPRTLHMEADPYVEVEQARLRAASSGRAQVLLIVPRVDSYRPPEMMPVFPPRETHAVISTCPGCGASLGGARGMIQGDELHCDRCGEVWICDSVADGVGDWRRGDGVRVYDPEQHAAQLEAGP